MKYKKHRAKTWDKLYKKGVNWDSDKPSTRIMNFMEYLNKKDKVLDLGCGPGRDVIYLAKNGFDSYGVDFSKVAIEKARKRYAGKKLHLFVSKSEKLPFKDNFCDAVYSGYVLYYTDMKKSILEISRVTKKNGIVYLVFALSKKFIKTGKIIHLIKEKEIISLIAKFKLLKKEMKKIENLKIKRPYRASVLVLVLKRR